jgi:hypothetical protein
MGTLARRARSPRLVAHFAAGCFWALRALAAEPSAARARELAETIRGWAEGMLIGDRWSAPVSLIARAPAPIAEALAGRPVRGLAVNGDKQLRYACGDDLLLSVGAAPDAETRVVVEADGAIWALAELN